MMDSERNDEEITCSRCERVEEISRLNPLPHRMTGRGVLCAECFRDLKMSERIVNHPQHLVAPEVQSKILRSRSWTRPRDLTLDD